MANLRIRRRISSSLVSIFILPLIVLSLSDLDFGSKPTIHDLKSPSYEAVPPLSVHSSRKFTVFVLPDNPITHSFCSRLPLSCTFLNDSLQIFPAIYSPKHAIAFNFVNSDHPDFLKKPQISVLTKDLNPDIEKSVLLSICSAFSLNSTDQVHLHKRQFAGKTAVFTSPSDSLIVMFVVFPFVSIITSESRLFVLHKESKLHELLLLSGCRLAPFWFATVSTSVISSLPASLLISYYFTNEYLLVGSDFTLLFALFFCYTLSLSLFSLSISARTATARGSRSAKLAFTLLSLGFSLTNHLLATANGHFWPHLLAVVFPQLAFTHGLSSAFAHCRRSGALAWRDAGASRVRWSLSTLLISAAFHASLLILTVLAQQTSFDRGRLRALLAARPRAFFAGARRAIAARGLAKSYAGAAALSGVSFAVAPGHVVGVLGSNGSGKSTLAGLLCGAIRPDIGSLSLFGRANGSDDVRQCCGVCFQESVLIPQLTVRQHLMLFGAVRGISPAVLRPRADFLEGALRLADDARVLARDLSGGQRRKLCVALALLGRPPVVVLDEPTAGVDCCARQVIWRVIAAENGRGVTLITMHDLEQAEAVCSRLLLLRRGRLEFCGTAAELRRRFNCGYRLTVVGEGYDRRGFAEWLAEVAGEVVEVPNRGGCWVLPFGEGILAVLDAMERRAGDFGVREFTFEVQSLEDVVLKIAERDDAPLRTPT